MSQVNCYGQRLLSPFQGVMQTIDIEHGVAESMDGVNWILYVNHKDIVSHTGMSEIRYGSWSEHGGLKLSMVRGTETNHIIEQVGEKLVTAVAEHSKRVPFRLTDHHECWLMTTDDKPLVLIDSTHKESKKRTYSSPAWHPGMAAFNESWSEQGDAKQLQLLVNQRAGSRRKTLWVSRQQTASGYNGDAITDDGHHLPANAFPPRLLLDQWPQENESILISDYLSWQAPWLLQTESFDDTVRRQLEIQAWRRPILCAQQYRLFAKILDPRQLNIIRVQARLMGHDTHGQTIIETFIQTGDKDTYFS